MRIASLSLVLFSLLSCTPGAQARQDRYPAPISPGYHQNLSEAGLSYDLYVPPLLADQEASHRYRLMLVLPGWKFDKSRWIKETELKAYADQYSMILVLPQMHTSIYASSYFPETRMKWNPTPGLELLNKKFIPGLNARYGLFEKGKQNYLLGLSTGGRGVALLALSNPGMFMAGASFSGDFDQSVMPTDNLMTAVYGPFEKYSKRWREMDNPVNSASQWNMPIYLSHGKADRIVPPDQTLRFYRAIQSEKGTTVNVQLNMVDGAGHDFRFWNQQLKPAFEFLRKYFDDSQQL
ncbi:MAG: alpha/beta hydrolase [Spirochaetaceae bacterium]|nr:alpha/beta hydrolase [Spirochaetaceae bacterium]